MKQKVLKENLAVKFLFELKFQNFRQTIFFKDQMKKIKQIKWWEFFYRVAKLNSVESLKILMFAYSFLDFKENSF